jgi:hypothetical protein
VDPRVKPEGDDFRGVSPVSRNQRDKPLVREEGMLQDIDNFSVYPCSISKKEEEKGNEYLSICFDDQDTGLILPGVSLEKQVLYMENWFLFITHDCPYEERLDIIALNRCFKIIDSSTTEWITAGGFFENIFVDSPNSFVFDFIGNKPWRVEFFDHPRFLMPCFSEPRGVWRSLRRRHWFQISHPLHDPRPPRPA